MAFSIFETFLALSIIANSAYWPSSSASWVESDIAQCWQILALKLTVLKFIHVVNLPWVLYPGISYHITVICQIGGDPTTISCIVNCCRKTFFHLLKNRLCVRMKVLIALNRFWNMFSLIIKSLNAVYSAQ